MTCYKLNREGVYLPFPGLTVIATVKTDDNEFWRKINNIITDFPSLSEYYAPLSNSSYHMTTMNLFTEQEIGRAEWERFVVSHTEYFKLLKDDIEQSAFNPMVTIESLEFGRTIRLLVDLPGEQKEIITDIARKYNLLKKIPHPFHVTLAYRYKHFDNAISPNIEYELKNYLSQLLHDYKSVLSLNHPKLCFFHDMNGFTPWDIREYPFMTV